MGSPITTPLVLTAMFSTAAQQRKAEVCKFFDALHTDLDMAATLDGITDSRHQAELTVQYKLAGNNIPDLLRYSDAVASRFPSADLELDNNSVMATLKYKEIEQKGDLADSAPPTSQAVAPEHSHIRRRAGLSRDDDDSPEPLSTPKTATKPASVCSPLTYLLPLFAAFVIGVLYYEIRDLVGDSDPSGPV